MDASALNGILAMVSLRAYPKNLAGVGEGIAFAYP